MSTNLENKLNAILNEKKEKILPQNIKKGVTIFNIEGTLEELDTTDATATATDIMLNKTAYVNGEKITGTANPIETTITPSATQQIKSGLFNKVTVTGDSNLIAENIAKDVTIFGVTGTHEGGGDFTQSEEYKNCYAISQDILYAGGVTKDLLVKYDLTSYEGGTIIPNMLDEDFANISGSVYRKGDKGLILDGAWIITEDIRKAYGTVELFCKVNADFAPVQVSDWYNCSTIFGCELGDIQQDFGILVDKNGNFAIGYANSSIQSSSIKANDGKYHHVVITYETGSFKLYVDNVLATSVLYTMKGTVPISYGIFWNNANLGTVVKGELVLFRYYDRVIADDERTINYQSCLKAYMEGE